MNRTSRSAVRVEKAKATPAAVTTRAHPLLVGVLAWWVPGAGHFLQGFHRKGLTFFGVLTAMFVIGLVFGGRLFPIQMREPLPLLAALAEWAIALPRVVAGIGGLGAGNVVAVTYEYGNTFLIVSGLLNALVLLDALDRAAGRKPQ
jgi:hypothetical protein